MVEEEKEKKNGSLHNYRLIITQNTLCTHFYIRLNTVNINCTTSSSRLLILIAEKRKKEKIKYANIEQTCIASQ